MSSIIKWDRTSWVEEEGEWDEEGEGEGFKDLDEGGR